MRNVRFWTMCNGSPVKLTLRDGRSVHHYHSAPTDEGWHSEAQCWTHDGRRVVCEWTTDGVDCDGRLRRSGESEFAIGRERAGYVDGDGVRFPDWVPLSSIQRDYSAEAMGY